MVAAAPGTAFALTLPPGAASGGLPGRKPSGGVHPRGRRIGRLLVASAGAHVAGLAAFLSLQWREPAPHAGASVEMVFTAPAEPVAPATPPDAPALDAAMPQALVPDTPALPEPVASAVPPPPTPAPVLPPAPVLAQPLAQAPLRAPARPAPSPAKSPLRHDALAARTPAARAVDAAQSLPGPTVNGSASMPRPPAPLVDPGPVIVTNPRFRMPPMPPAYPALAREQGQEGEAVIRARLDRDGNPDEVLLAASSGFPVLDRAALAAVRRWAFEPGRRGGEPVAAWVQVPVRFALR